MKIDSSSSERLSILRFPMIVGVVFIHAYVLVDTNILVSGLFAESGRIAELMNLWANESFELVTSEEILAELYKTFHKPSIQGHFDLSEEEIMEYLTIIKERAHITPGLYKTDRIKKYPSDNRILACAIEAKAEFIVSGDRHLKEIKEFHGIKIVDARAFVEIIRGGREKILLARNMNPSPIKLSRKLEERKRVRHIPSHRPHLPLPCFY